MANFIIAEQKTSKVEGGYSNDPDDPGKETILGISRRYHPDLYLWKLVDLYEQKDMAVQDSEIRSLAKTWYKLKFWDCYLADFIEDQDIANELYDSGVNLGQKRIVKWIQTALNVLNRREKSWANIKVDGAFGKQTLRCLNNAITRYNEKDNILKLLNAYQGAYYSFKCEENEVKEKYLHGWLKRC